MFLGEGYRDTRVGARLDVPSPLSQAEEAKAARMLTTRTSA